MADAANPFEAVQAMMFENFEKVQSATQSYIDTVEKAMRGIPGVAANEDFVENLLRAKDYQEAFRVQVEYFQSQLKAIAEDANQIGTKMTSSFKTS